jgi:NADPH2:quinone reductase
MKAIVIHQYGPPDVLTYQDVADPQPRAGEVRIRVHAATVNRVLDVSLRAGREMYRNPELPLIPGVDCAGIIDAVGSGVTRFKVGQHAAAAGTMPLADVPEDCTNYTGPTGMMGIRRPGGFAELVCVPAAITVPLPEALDFHDAAVVMRHAPTAWNLLINTAQLQPGETVLVMGAGGNLGRTGIQIAKNIVGAKVIAAAGSDDRVQQGIELGADFGVNYNSVNIREEVLRLTDGKGVNVLYDNIANPKVLPEAFMAIGFRGRLVTAGAHGGPNVTINFAHLYHKQIRIIGQPGSYPPDLPKCFQAAAEGKIKVQIEKLLPLSKAVDAHRFMESGEVTGKIVLDPTLG